MSKEPNYLGGHKKLWHIYPATKQDKSKQRFSIFQLEKKKMDKKLNNEDALAVLRKECSVLMRFKHPNILSIVEPLMVIY